MKNAEQKKYSISEFAKACGTTKDTLYHYEKQGLLVPAFDDNNHYRHYSSGDFHLFQYIAHLRRMGFSVSDIKKCLESRNVETYLEMLRKGQKNCLDQINELKHRCCIISEALSSTSDFRQITLDTIRMPFLEEAYFYAAPFSGKLNSLEGIQQIQHQLSIAESLPDITSNLTVFKIRANSVRTGISPKLCIMTQTAASDAIDSEHLHIRPAGSYLQIFLKTDLISSTEDELLEHTGNLLKYAEEHNYRITTDFYCYQHISSFLTDDPKEFLTEFLVGVN